MKLPCINNISNRQNSESNPIQKISLPLRQRTPKDWKNPLSPFKENDLQVQFGHTKSKNLKIFHKGNVEI